LKIAKFTIDDELHFRSFYVLAGVSVLFVFMLRGCYKSTMVLNGQQLDTLTIGWKASLAAFHVISAAGILFGILLGMRVFKRDSENGMTVSILSKPVNRIDYIIGKIAGVWMLSYGLTFLLHLTVYIIMLVNTGGRIHMFFPASLITGINILLVILLVMLFSLIMPDVIAALSSFVIVVVSFLSDSLYAASKTEIIKSMLEQIQNSELTVALWRILWPKIAASQYYASSLIDNGQSYYPGPVNPVVNVVLFCTIVLGLIYWRFSLEEIR